MGYAVELIEDAFKLHGPNQNLCAQYCEARAMVDSGDERQLVNVDCALFNPSPPSTVTLTRLQEYKGWLYRTAHERRVDQKAHASDGMILVDVPFGWDLCFFDADVQYICRDFGWSSHALVLADGSICFTAACVQEYDCTPGS